VRLMSERQYAEHRKARGLPGGTQAAVNKAVSAGRIAKVIDAASKRLMIDPAIADAQWASNTDPDQQLRGHGGVLPEVKPAPAAAVQTSALVARVQTSGLDRDDLDALRFYAGLEAGLLSLPSILAAEGAAQEGIERVLNAVYDAIRGELDARKETRHFIAGQLETLRTMVQDERACPGMWTGT
jgi:hypothetical protein